MDSTGAVSANGNLRVVLWLSVIVVTLTVLVFLLRPLLIPLLIAFSLYALCEPVHAWLMRNGVDERASAMIIVVSTGIAVIVLMNVLATPVSTQFQHLLERLPAISDAVSETVSVFLARFDLPTAQSSLFVFSEKLQQQLGEFALAQGSDFVLGLFSILIFVPLITFFLLKDFKKFRSWSLSRLSNASFELGWIIYSRVVDRLQHYIRGILLQSLVVALICSTGFYAVGFESYILLGVLAGIFNIIPYVGPLLAMILPSLIILSEVPFDAAALFMTVGVVLFAQLIDNVFIIPLIIANSVDLHPLVVILGLIIFGSAFGLLGMVLAVPVMVTVNLIYSGLRSGLYVRTID